jgi:hypothetical protein
MTANKSTPVAHQFKPGHKIHSGRASGSRNKLNEKSVRMLLTLADKLQVRVDKFGDVDLDALRIENPAKYWDVIIKLGEVGMLRQQDTQGGAIVKISINRFFPDEKPGLTIDGVNVPDDDQPPE